MALSEFDKQHIGEIINGMGDWFSARLIRALHDLLPFADIENTARIKAAFPEEVNAYLKWFNSQSGVGW